MRSGSFKSLFPAMLVFSGVVVCPVAMAAETPWTDRFFQEFDQVKSRLIVAENQRAGILARQEQILKELDSLRIQLRRKPRKKA
ncbi:MAG TPA: hypothetical protein PLH16_03265 [Candidatus Omnitrophota bacterium]|nr:hypothetical protein [Candidatus Omnitrophota bacterium]